MTIKNFTQAEKNFIDLCHEFPPNLDLIHQKLKNEINPNAFEEDYSNVTCRTYLLPEVIYNFGFDENNFKIKRVGCRYLPDIIRLFLEAGFDPSNDCGRAGSDAIASLIFCLPDYYLLPSAELLLAAGADPKIANASDEPYEDAIERIHFEAFVLHTQADFHEAKIFYRLQEFIEDYVLVKNLGTKTFEFVKACQENRIDFSWIEEQLKNGININTSFLTHTSEGYEYQQFLIHEILAGFGWYPSSVNNDEGFGCAELPKLLDLLFKYGLDMSLDEGRSGARSLYNICRTMYDDNSVKAAKMLLDHGANPNIPLYTFSDQTFTQYIGIVSDHRKDLTGTTKFDEIRELLKNL